ncbi:hypothetical protein GH714_040202 [Hevea brasiliensis]|uniref:F-box domain-containing protein n=1 Tax=Hevea brasiliensis TaxID=3981 RepID=A0A6A6MTN9_HEVBR|nr:hypothetical protein GH714_040202 [Hevea brasiliensis]
MSTMENRGDFVQRIGADMSIEVFLHLDDPSDLARVCSVSSSWRYFVIANGLFKKLCLKLLPEMYSVAHFIEVNNMIEPVRVGQSDCMEWECLKRNHRVYAQLARGLTPILQNDCISEAISASSTDNYPEESIWNTLEPNDKVGHGASYWSSKGQSNPTVPEALVYKFIANLCLITEIHIQPFQDSLCLHISILPVWLPYISSKAVRFRLGHHKFPLQLENNVTVNSAFNHNSMDDKFIWTYTSPEFPMAQAVGRPLSHPFDVEILDPTGKCTLKYSPLRESRGSHKGETCATSRLQMLTVRLMERRKGMGKYDSQYTAWHWASG